MTTSARTVADEIRKRIPNVGELKLHKLLYYAQGHHLAMLDAPLFSDTISAWDMGPVVGTSGTPRRTRAPSTGTTPSGKQNSTPSPTARALGISVGTVKSYAREALARLRELGVGSAEDEPAVVTRSPRSR